MLSDKVRYIEYKMILGIIKAYIFKFILIIFHKIIYFYLNIIITTAMSALRGLCISPEFRAVVVREGILDPLVLMSRSDDVMVR